MPELPEVETTVRGLAPHVQNKEIVAVTVRDRRLRWPVEAGFEGNVSSQVIHRLRRRAKYLIFSLDSGDILAHLGMSGSYRLVPPGTPPAAHDHVDVDVGTHWLRYHDPRRFGSLHWCPGSAEDHFLLRSLGPEPLSDAFNGAYLKQRARGRKMAVKPFIMDASVVVGVGNIYASESLFRAGIHPTRPAMRVSQDRYERLARAIKQVLAEAIAQGGTTLRDFVSSEGNPGYFAHSLQVYGRDGQPCPGCGDPIRRRVLGQRATYYCTQCQK